MSIGTFREWLREQEVNEAKFDIGELWILGNLNSILKTKKYGELPISYKGDNTNGTKWFRTSLIVANDAKEGKTIEVYITSDENGENFLVGDKNGKPFIIDKKELDNANFSVSGNIMGHSYAQLLKKVKKLNEYSKKPD